MRYKVKWQDGSETRYGIFYGDTAFTKRGKVAARPGHVFVTEALNGKSHELPLTVLRDIEDDYGKFNQKTGVFEGGDEYEMFIQKALAEAEAKDRAGAGKFVEGRMFHTPVGDGSASYVVTQVRPRTCNIEWRGFCADRWVDRAFGYGGSFPNSLIKRMLGL